MATHIKNMTQGRPGKLILTFSLPLMAGNVFQQTYTVIDTAVAGKLENLTLVNGFGVICPLQ